jgi:hypothetical protein
VLVLAVSYFVIDYLRDSIKLKVIVEKISVVLKRFFGIPSFFNYPIVDGIYNLLFPNKTALMGINSYTIDEFQLCFELG